MIRKPALEALAQIDKAQVIPTELPVPMSSGVCRFGIPPTAFRYRSSHPNSARVVYIDESLLNSKYEKRLYASLNFL